MHRPTFSLVIPAYNEARRLPPFLARCTAYLRATFPDDHEILVADDGSTDDTASIVTSTLGRASLVRLAVNRGKGAAVRAGMLAAKGRYRLFADADGATPIQEERRLRRAIGEGCDVAIGSRAAKGGMRRFGEALPHIKTADQLEASEPVTWDVRLHRHLIGRVFSMLVKGVVGVGYRDTQCGFKMFTAAAAEEIFGRTAMDGFVMDVEALYLAHRLGLRVSEIAVNWQDVDGSKVSLVRDSSRMLSGLVRLRSMHGDLEAKRSAPTREP